jgi:ATPase family associated with various cellular activities (AAA)
MKPAPKASIRPSQFAPAAPGDFIGPAGARARVLIEKAGRIASEGGTLRIILYGAPGGGKSRLAELLASTLGESDIQRLNGRNLRADTVRRWMEESAYLPLFGWRIKLVNEIDLATTEAQDLLLDFLDSLPPRSAVIGTSNLNANGLTERFQTRFQSMRVELPLCEEIEAWLVKRWKLPLQAARAIAIGSGGNVRAALLDAESFMDERHAA